MKNLRYSEVKKISERIGSALIYFGTESGMNVGIYSRNNAEVFKTNFNLKINIKSNI